MILDSIEGKNTYLATGGGIEGVIVNPDIGVYKEKISIRQSWVRGWEKKGRILIQINEGRRRKKRGCRQQAYV
ncbi:MAG: hypothetical protein NZ901_12035 [Geminocystis sp.]|nr:hypothetical protein [Geminocystis sp.]HIK37498.1 hypothetical protein [Geminocystis sp. M7585_C2015_104]MCS7148898.1 hypothetical protein [Geminocystis sp.]MCX8078668.1 hypothetical protein [Geminocystis sp.]MDW8116983.1 hypothetical protein [Geminocystis sp.]